MKLAQALTLRKQLKSDIAKLAGQAQRNAVRSPDYSGKLPPLAGNPNEDVRDLISASENLEQLVNAINFTNAATLLPNGQPINEALAHRDMLLNTAQLLDGVANTRAPAGSVMELDAKTARAVANQHARLARELDDLIQQANWNTELITKE